jgi:hypothetical protein
VAKRQRRRLLSAPPQVRILPLVPMSPSASWLRPPPPQGGDQGSNPCGDAKTVRPRPWEDRSPSKRSRAGSNPAGRTTPSRSDWNGRRATNAEIGGSNPPGGTGPVTLTIASVVQQKNAGPTCRRRGCDSLRSHRTRVAQQESIGATSRGRGCNSLRAYTTMLP